MADADDAMTGADATTPVAAKRSTSGADEGKENPAKVRRPTAAPASSVISEELLDMYYDKLFPFHDMYLWLSYGSDLSDLGTSEGPNVFQRREFSFTVGEIYSRYLTCANEEAFRKLIRDRRPEKIDIGPVYTVPADQRNTVAKGTFEPVERELVFDIDLTDYDDIRNCCSAANICSRCWRYVTGAIKVIHAALQEDFGFRHILWVYSGRRGIHCWVCDTSARQLSNQERSAIVEYFSIITGGGDNARRIAVTYPLLPCLKRAVDFLEPYFVDTVICKRAGENGFGFLDNGADWSKILDLIPLQELKDDLTTGFAAAADGLTRWRMLKSTVLSRINEASKTSASGQQGVRVRLNQIIPTIVFAFTYPRLDAEVSKHQNHLLKSPWCVHPKTGRVCVPIDPAKCDEFDPLNVPTLEGLQRELNENPDKPTSLKPYLQYFQNQFLAPLRRALTAESRAGTWCG